MPRSILFGALLTLIFVSGSALYLTKKSFSLDFLPLLLQADKKYLLLSLFSIFLYHTFDNLRLFILSRAMKVRYSFMYGYLVSFVNAFGATITPAHMGGEFMSVYALSRRGSKLYKVMGVVTMKTLTGGTFFLLVLPYTLYHFYKNPTGSLKILAVLVLFAGIFALLYVLVRLLSRKGAPQNQNLLKGFRYTVRRYTVVLRIFLRDRKPSLLLACISSFLLYLSFLASGAFLVKSFNPEPDFVFIVEHQLTLLYAIFISPTPGGSGVGEVGALYVFDSFLEASLLGSFSLLWRFVTQYASALLGGLLLLFLLLRDARKNV
ncbi:MAG: flippase-like domain-containing protein [Aquificaceae bacterium]|nr:flippase-like domain-containing protein [Aquificaceae bacterium]MDW8097069.1 flippase-like domain-containing protein [Aquificaceae bacterium]